MGLSGKICLKQDDRPNAEIELLTFRLEVTLRALPIQACPGRQSRKESQAAAADVEEGGRGSTERSLSPLTQLIARGHEYYLICPQNITRKQHHHRHLQPPGGGGPALCADYRGTR